MWITTSLGRLFISERLSGKMAGIWAISTSCLANPFCKGMQKCSQFICSKCYAKSYQEYRKQSRDAYTTNYETLNSGLLNEKDLVKLEDVFCTRIARIESFGEVGSVVQARNYIKIINVNKGTQFGIWTKRLDIWLKAIEEEGGKPENCSLVASSPKTGEVLTLTEEQAKVVDTIFTVYDKEQVAQMGIEINCGAKACMKCQKCYKRHSEVQYVSELIK